MCVRWKGLYTGRACLVSMTDTCASLLCKIQAVEVLLCVCTPALLQLTVRWMLAVTPVWLCSCQMRWGHRESTQTLINLNHCPTLFQIRQILFQYPFSLYRYWQKCLQGQKHQGLMYWPTLPVPTEGTMSITRLWVLSKSVHCHCVTHVH